MSIKDRLKKEVNKKDVLIKDIERTFSKIENTSDEFVLDENVYEKNILFDYLNDKNVDKIFINKGVVYIEKKGKEYKTDTSFDSPEDVINIIHQMIKEANVSANLSKKIINFKLPDASRVTAIMPPCVNDFPILLIKKIKNIQGTLESLMGLDMISHEMALLLEAVVNLNLNVLIVGGENSGKTTLLGAMAKKIQTNKRVMSFERTPELKLDLENCMSFHSDNSDTLNDLLKKSIEFNPDKIILSDCDILTSKTLLELSLGGKNFISTINANSIENAMKNFEGMINLNYMNFDIANPSKYIYDNIDVVIELKRFGDNSIKLVNISEIEHKKDECKLNNIFFWDYTDGVNGKFFSSGNKPKFLEKTGFEMYDLIFDRTYNHTNKSENKKTKINEEEVLSKQIEKLHSHAEKINVFKKLKRK